MKKKHDRSRSTTRGNNGGSGRLEKQSTNFRIPQEYEDAYSDEQLDQAGTKVAIRANKPDLFLEQHVASLFYDKTSPGKGKQLEFNDERDFWTKTETLPLSNVQITNVRLSDWFPRAPGVFWSRHGIKERRYSWRDYAFFDDPKLGRIFSPGSKMSLIEGGGIGTVRLQPRRIDGILCWLSTGISGPHCAGGIPLAIPHALMSKCNLTWGESVSLSGQVRYLQDVGLGDVASAVHHTRPLIVFVEKIRGIAKKGTNDPIILSPVVLFDNGASSKKESRNWHGLFDLRYAFVQFAAGNDSTIDKAADWLKQYTAKYDGRIITNFDEQRPVLANAPLSYQRLVAKNFDRTIIENLHFSGEKLTDRIDNITQENVMSVNIKFGKGATNSGNIVVAKSIRSSFNRVKKSNADSNLRKLLERLASEVGDIVPHLDAEKAKNVADDLDALTKEATSEKPRREWWKLSIKGLKSAATAVKDIGKPILETVKLISPLLTDTTK